MAAADGTPEDLNIDEPGREVNTFPGQERFDYGPEELHIPASYQFPFAQNAESFLGGPYAGRISRGCIEQLRTMVTLDSDSGVETNTGVRLGLNFFLNPSVLHFTYSLRNDLYLPTDQTPIEQDVKFLPDTRGFTLELLFDRTFEVWRGMVENSPSGVGMGPRKISEVGVLEDVRQLERMVGISDTGLPLVGVPLIFYPNGKTPGETYLGAFPEIRFQIQSMTVAYTMFSHKMIPIRAAVDIQCIQYYAPQSAATNAPPYSGVFPYIDPAYENPNDVTPTAGGSTAPPNHVPGGTSQ